MTKNLPAYRYELFIKAFEKRVTAAQKEIERLRKMEQPYNVVKEVMQAARLPNDQDVSMTAGSIGITITAAPDDSLEAFEQLMQQLGTALLAHDLHRDGKPATSHGGSHPCLYWTWSCKGFQVYVYVSLPAAGLRDADVVITERQSIDREYVVRRKEPERYPAPPNFTKGTPSPSELARIEAELGDPEELDF